MPFHTLNDFDFENKKVLVRVDFNVPLDNEGNIESDKRISAAVPTIDFLVKHNAKVIVISHLGRPKGVEESLKMDKIAERLSYLLGKNVKKMNDCIGKMVEGYIFDMEPGDIILLENVRFHSEEENVNDPVREDFAKELSKLVDIYVNDAFGVSHRKQASVYEITKFLPSAAGFLMEKEINTLSKVLDPEKPFYAIIGGVKISDKIAVINNLLNKANKILLGGGMIFTFYKAKGYEIGMSVVENDKINLATFLMKNPNIVLPKDVVIAEDNREDANYDVVGYNQIPKGYIGLDIGPKTIKEYKEILKDAKTIVWNGPLGKFEWKNFAKGTNEIANFLATLKANIIIGGGDTGSAIAKLGIAENFFISTGGGAALEFLEGIKLPGIKALEENYKKFK